MREYKESKFVKMMRILSILSENRWTSSNHLAEELNVSKRSIMRYIQDINLPFENQGRGIIESSIDGYKLLDTNFLDKLKGIDDQYTIAAIQLSPFGNALNSKPIIKEEILEKLRPRLNKALSFPNEVSDKLLKSLTNNRILIFEYQNHDGIFREYKVLPLKIVANNETNYLLCYSLNPGNEKILSLVISKIQNIKTSEVFRDRNLIAEKLLYFDSRWGTFPNDSGEYEADVSFEVDELMYERLKKNPLHRSQEYEYRNGQHVFYLKVHNALEFARWTMKFGWHINVISPKFVISILIGEAEEIVKKYHK